MSHRERGGAVFSSVFGPKLNGLGQLVFRGWDDDSRDGIWAYTEDQLELVIQEGNQLEVAPGVLKTISSFNRRRSVFTDAGEFTFAASFSDGSRGVFVAQLFGTAPPGDYSNNGTVDGTDFLMWQRGESPNPMSSSDLATWEANYGTAPIQPGDFDGNGKVDGHDFLNWQRDPSVGSLADWEANYGTVAPLSASSAAVPEPSSFLLATLAGLYGLGATHRRKRK